MDIVKAEVRASEYQTKISHYLGRPITKAEALEAFRLHREVGDGGNTVGWKFDACVNNITECTHHEHTSLGDAAIDLGRLTNDTPQLKWCFPETYKAYNKVDESEKLKFM